MSRPRWRPAYIGLGSNLQGPVRQLEQAFDALQGVPDTRLIVRSSLYRTAPYGGVEQPDFVNAVAALLTMRNAPQLLADLQAIERKQGRERDELRWGPRVLDLDLLVFSDQRIDDAAITVPHAGIGERNFVLLPLREIAPDLVIPGLGRVANIEYSETEPTIEKIA